jgi:hypothetical protein
MSSELLDEKIISKYSGLIYRYHNRYLADESLSNDDVLILSIYLREEKKGETGASREEVSQLFASLRPEAAKYFRQCLYSLKKKRAIIDDYKGGLISLTMKGLRKVWNILGQTEKSRVYVIRSGKQFTAVKILEELLKKEMKCQEVLLCDPYIDSSTLFPFVVLKGQVNIIKILTSNISDEEKFQNYKRKFEKETSIKVEVRKVKSIHDRWLICGDKCWSIGASLKDLGNKHTIIQELEGIRNSLHELFLISWKEGELQE